MTLFYMEINLRLLKFNYDLSTPRLIILAILCSTSATEKSEQQNSKATLPPQNIETSQMTRVRKLGKQMLTAFLVRLNNKKPILLLDAIHIMRDIL